MNVKFFLHGFISHKQLKSCSNQQPFQNVLKNKTNKAQKRYGGNFITQWIYFENDCVRQLRSEFGKFAEFKHEGGSNSKVSDIRVIPKNGKAFYIDVKHCPAQCGQFVLLPDLKSRRFRYSPRNSSQQNEYSSRIINHMNRNFEKYCNAGTSGKEIAIGSSSVLSDWVIRNLKEKNVKFVMTNDFYIIPVDDIPKYFSISAVYRIKRSGSSNVGKKRMPLLHNYIFSNYECILHERRDNTKMYISSCKSPYPDRFFFGNDEFFFSEKEGGEYEIKKLSNTFNMNVIFSIRILTLPMKKTPAKFLIAIGAK